MPSPSSISRPLLLLSGRGLATRPAHYLAFSRPSSTSSDSTFQTGPAPPRLPPKEQAEFERLQRTANTQEGFNPSATPSDFTIPIPTSTPTATSTVDTAAAVAAGEETTGTPLRKGAPPEFAGDVNPQTGEVGGPKNEPLRWGPAGDYSFNGRVTDF